MLFACSAHTRNWVVNDAATYYVFFSAYTRCWEVPHDHVSNLTVKPLNDTRLESRIDALKPFCYQLGDSYDDLVEIADNTNLTGELIINQEYIQKLFLFSFSHF